MEGSLACSVAGCGSTFSSVSTLRRHVRIVHEGSKFAACTVCSKSFRDNYTLRVHSKVHSDPEYDNSSSLDCPVCHKSFTLRAAFSNHIKIHKKIKPQKPPEDCDAPAIKCFVCDEHLHCAKFLAHLQAHVKKLITACNETVDTLKKCEVSLEQADDALNGE